MVKLLIAQSWLSVRRLLGALCAVALLGVMVFNVAGCERAENKQVRSQKTIGVTLLTVQHQFYQDLRDGLQNEADKHGYRIFVSTAEFDPARQANQIDEFIVQRVDVCLPKTSSVLNTLLCGFHMTVS